MEEPQKTKEKRSTRFTSENQPSKRGRPKGSVSVVVAMRKKLQEAAREGGGTRLEAVAEALLNGAEAGSINHIRTVLEYVDGKPADKTEHTGKDGGPIQVKGFEIVIVDPKAD